MVTIDELLDWKPNALSSTADALNRRRQSLIGLQGDIDGAKPPATWASGAGDKARAEHERLRLRLNDLVAEVADVLETLDAVEPKIAQSQQQLRDALDHASQAGLHVNHATGEVQDPKTYHDQGAKAAADKTLKGVVEVISAALKAATAQDAVLAAVLSDAAQGKDDGGTGSLTQAGMQLAPWLRGKSKQQIANILAGDVAINDTSAELDADIDLIALKLDGKVKADEVVMEDGKVMMTLHVEGGVGKELDIPGGGKAEIGAGGEADLELKFDNDAKAKEFLQGLKDTAENSAGDVLTGQAGDAAKNIAAFIQKQHIESFKLGGYAEAGAEAHDPLVHAAAHARLEAQYDFVKHQTDISVGADASAGLGDKDDPAAEFSSGATGTLTLGEHGRKSFDLTGTMGAEGTNRALGLPGHTGVGSDVKVSVNSSNPYWPRIEDAAKHGDFGLAKQLAYQHGDVTYRTFTTEKGPEFDGSAHVPFTDKGVDVKFKVENQHTTQIYVRPHGQRVPEMVPVRGS